MKPELRAKIIAFNKKRAEEGEKATDMDIIVGKLLALHPGQLKKVLDEEALAGLAKYGYTDEGG
mgnify:CR=1 FL=1